MLTLRGFLEIILQILKVIDLSDNIKNEEPVVVTVGFFDGVHKGHRFLIDQVKETAAKKGIASAVVTFPIHPRKVLQKDYQPALLSSFDEKLQLLETTSVDYVIVIPFSIELSEFTAEQFIKYVLKDRINTQTLIVGHDHRFGHNRIDGFDEYKVYGAEVGMEVIKAKELRIDNGNVSSSKIRALLKDGDIVKANKLLSYNYTLSGKIVEGYQVGRTIGFPTANIRSWERFKVVPKLGVYAVLVHINELTYQGMLYIGKRPTLHNDSSVSVEVNIFNFEGNLYNKSLTVEFIDFIREDTWFDSMEKLVKRIHQDKIEVKKRLKEKQL